MDEVRELIGHTAVDSGELGIIDPCYVDSQAVDDYCQRKLAVRFRTEVGDGYFPVYAKRDNGGLVAIEGRFDEWQPDDEDDY